MSLRFVKPLLKRGGFFMAVLLMLSGCSWLPNMAKPEVTLTSISLGPTGGLTQMLQLGLRVYNPNTFDLTINRLNYKVFLEGSELAFGKRNEVLKLAAGDSASFTVPVELNLLSGLSVIQKMLNNPSNSLKYRLDVDADVANFGFGLVRVSKESTIDLTPK